MLVSISAHNNPSGGNYNVTVIRVGEDSLTKVTFVVRSILWRKQHVTIIIWLTIHGLFPAMHIVGKKHTQSTPGKSPSLDSVLVFIRAHCSWLLLQPKVFHSITSVWHVSHILQHLTKLPVIPGVSEFASLLMCLQRFLLTLLEWHKRLTEWLDLQEKINARLQLLGGQTLLCALPTVGAVWWNV